MPKNRLKILHTQMHLLKRKKQLLVRHKINTSAIEDMPI